MPNTCEILVCTLYTIYRPIDDSRATRTADISANLNYEIRAYYYACAHYAIVRVQNNSA